MKIETSAMAHTMAGKFVVGIFLRAPHPSQTKPDSLGVDSFLLEVLESAQNPSKIFKTVLFAT